MAQLVEHILGKDEVISSNLISSSRKRQISVCRFLFLLRLFTRGFIFLEEFCTGIDSGRLLC